MPKPTKTALTSGLFVTLDDVPDPLRVVYWGKEGSAKTTNALTMANIGPTIVINAEGGVKKKALQKRGINTDNIQVWPKPGEDITYGGLEKVYLAVKSALKNDPDSLVGIVFDSITDVVQALVDQVSDDRVDKIRDQGRQVDEIQAFWTDRSDFGTMSKMARDLIRKFRDLPINVVYLALERQDVDKDNSITTYGPAVTPGVMNDLVGYADIVMHCVKPTEDRPFFRGAVRNTGPNRTKDRLDLLPDVMVEPTMERMLQYHDGTLTPENDPMQEQIRKAAEAEANKPKARRTRPARGKVADKKSEDADDKDESSE